ncbi:hypothetical protein LWI28_007089 [Acer negundo]|uniref:Secreted protein n=1 Tax=Acer negundo TaxID=4023 RepID=A0AAD5IPZ3_ACENE|nr:hypothetical protein LWI28_007089 [Acer negundo]KAK4843197.1 hypothetical protein QYF36_005205 [Acer negundo]
MERSSLRLLVVTSLLFFQLNEAVPVTRIGNLILHEPQLHHHQNTHQLVIAETILEEEKTMSGRMGVELNDYPGSGANNRHTPRQQFGRGCVDC